MNGAAEMPRREIASLPDDRYRVPCWWRQIVTVGYEQARGLRAVRQTASGHSASVRRTIAAPVEDIFAPFTEAARRGKQRKE